MDYDELRYGNQFLVEMVAILERNNLDMLAERLEEIANEVADEIDKEDLEPKEEEAA